MIETHVVVLVVVVIVLLAASFLPIDPQAKRVIYAVTGVGALLVLLVLFLGGCGMSETTARQTIATAGEVRAKVAEANAEAMRETAQRDLDASETRADFERRRAPYYAVEASGRLFEGVLSASERALDAAGTDAFEDLLPCVVGALLGLEAALAGLRDLGVDIELPPAAGAVLALASGYAGTCPLPTVTAGGAS